MTTPRPTPDSDRAERESWGSSVWLQSLAVIGGVILLATWAAYANSFWVPFIFDDVQTITSNPSIEHVWPPGPALSPPPGIGVSGRPLSNLSLALNHALSGESTSSYHALNLAIHVMASLVLLGIVRRTLERPSLQERFGHVARPLAGAVALLWAVHTLQTEAVTYISQRTESMMGLFYLLTLYAFVRSADALRQKWWLVASVAACLLGAMTKEVIVTAPVLVFLYDRTFVAGTFREAWRQRWGYYLGLASSWLLLGWLMQGLGSRNVGYGQGVTAWTYALTESRAIFHYLHLAAWPHPLIFDYGSAMATPTTGTLVCAAGIAALLAAVGWALARRPALGFVGAAVFLCLAPASSVVPVVMQPVAEHRMYLPLAGVMVLAVMGLQALAGRWTLGAVLVIAAAFGVRTAARNADYFSEVTLWRATVKERPNNPRARNNLGSALARDEKVEEARAQFAEMVRLTPNDALAHYHLGNALLQLGRRVEAIEECMIALKLNPEHVDAHCTVGAALAQVGRTDDAIEHFQTAARLDPSSVAAHFNLGQAYLNLNRYPEAAEHFAAVVRLQPDLAEAHKRLGDALAGLNRFDEARAHYAEAQRLSVSVAGH